MKAYLFAAALVAVSPGAALAQYPSAAQQARKFQDEMKLIAPDLGKLYQTTWTAVACNIRPPAQLDAVAEGIATTPEIEAARLWRESAEAHVKIGTGIPDSDAAAVHYDAEKGWYDAQTKAGLDIFLDGLAKYPVDRSHIPTSKECDDLAGSPETLRRIDDAAAMIQGRGY